MTPLSRAAFHGHLEIVELLVQEAGADVESKDSMWGLTPLGYSADHGHLEVVKFLVKEAGAEIESKDNGKTALDLAMEGAKYPWKEERCWAVAAWLETEEQKAALERVRRTAGSWIQG